jgi:hypothetical protein
MVCVEVEAEASSLIGRADAQHESPAAFPGSSTHTCTDIVPSEAVGAERPLPREFFLRPLAVAVHETA